MRKILFMTFRSLRESVFIFSVVFLALPIAAQSPLPEGEGKKVTERVCNQCHGPENYTRKKHSKSEWEAIVDDMVEKGAAGTDDEFDTIVRYLAKNFGKSTEKEMRASLLRR